MKRTAMTDVDCYPWPSPTDEQQIIFDNATQEERLEMLRQAIIEGEESGDAGVLDMDEIIREAKQEAGLLPKGGKP